MRELARWSLLAAAALLGGCVSLEEAPMTTGAIQKGQRVLLVVYAPPSPAIVESDSKAETAAKIVPGLGLVVKDAQDSHALAQSKDLQRYLPSWNPAALFRSSFTLQFDQLGQPGRAIGPSDTSIPVAAWYRLNSASDVNDWQIRYYLPSPDQAVSRNYSAFLDLDDAVVLEVNLLPTLATDDELTYTPTLSAVTKLYRANTMRQLWRHENTVSEAGAAHALYDFKVKPGDLIFAWNRLMPMLGAQITEDLRKNFVAAGVPLAPKPTLMTASYSPGSASFLPSGAGWAPAPASSPATTPAPPAAASGAPFVPHASTP